LIAKVVRVKKWDELDWSDEELLIGQEELNKKL
jgi:hypothetical protein